MGAELVVGIKSKFDGSGAEAASAGISNVGGRVDRATQSAKKMGDQFVDLEIKHRRLENTTRILGTELANTARGGFTLSAASQSASSAVGLLGNSLQFASGPLGLAVIAATALAEAFLTWYGNAQKAEEAVATLITSTEALTAAQQILATAGGISNENTIETLKMMEDQATATANLTKLADATAAAQVRYNEAKAKEKDLQDQVTAARQRQHHETAEYLAKYGAESDRASEELTRLEGKLTMAAATTGKAKDEAAQYSAAMDRATGSIKDMEPPLDRLIQMKEFDGLQTRQNMRDNKAYSDAAIEDINRELQVDIAAQKKKLAMRMLVANASASILGSMASLIESTANDEMEVVKALRIAEVGVNAVAGYMQAVASYPPPYGFLIGAAAIAAGVASAAQIASSNVGSASISAPSTPGMSTGGQTSSGPSPVGSNVGPSSAAPGYSGQSGGFSGTMNLTVNMQVNVLDPDSINNATLRRLGRRMAEIILFEINALGGTVSYG